MLPEKYKTQTSLCLDQLWSVWCSLGVYSEGKISSMAPEEAIVGLCIFGRYEQRLFDEALTFILQYSRILSKNRLLYLIKKIDNDSKRVFQVVAYFLEKMCFDKRFFSPSAISEKVLEESFFTSFQNKISFSGKEIDPIFLQFGFRRNTFTESEKLRNLTYISEHNQWIKAKLLFGNTIRVDTIMELICNKNCTAPMIAFNTGYTQKSIWNVLTDLEFAGLIVGKKSFNRIVYSLSKDGEKLFSQFRLKTNPPNISNWIKLGHLISAFSKLPNSASDLLIQSEEKRVKKLINKLKIEKINF
ncbi:MAG: hypothetical protein PVI26_14940 [Chitinispirillia bacterium]|jgi:predicted transcriptional regulator